MEYHYVLGMVHGRGFSSHTGLVTVDPGNVRTEVLDYLVEFWKKRGAPSDASPFSFSLAPNQL